MNDNDRPDDDLLQFVFGELNDTPQAAVRKAVSEDAELAAAVQGLETAVAAVLAENVGQVSDDFNDRLRRRMPEVLDSMPAETARSTLLTRSPNNWRWIMRSPVSRVAAAIIFVVAIGGVALWFHGGGATLTFADIVKPILEAKTAKYKMTFEMEGRAGKTSEVMVLAPWRVREEWREELPRKVEQRLVTITDYQKGKSLWLDPRNKTATVYTHDNMPKGAGSGDWFSVMRAIIRNAQNKHESLGEKVINGHKVVGYRSGLGQAMNLWCDRETGLPVRVDITVQRSGKDLKVTMSDFVFNVDLDESLFSLDPPAGYTTRDSSAKPEKTFTGKFEKKAQTTVTGKTEVNREKKIDATHTATVKGE
jgi:outer membrane lipoprotein-sorting protein